MSGLHNTLKFDRCEKLYETAVNNGIADYTLDIKAHTRAADVAPTLGLGRQPDFYGPLRGNRVRQESFMQGRGHTLSDCADCGVRQLPASVFPNNGRMAQPACQTTDLQGAQTRLPRACNGLSEIDPSCWTMFPGAYWRGYNGYNAVVGTNMQTRNDAAYHCDRD